MAWEREEDGAGRFGGEKRGRPGGGGGKHVGEIGSSEFCGSMVACEESGAGARYFPILDRRDRKLLFWEGCQGTLGSSQLLPRHVHTRYASVSKEWGNEGNMP